MIGPLPEKEYVTPILKRFFDTYCETDFENHRVMVHRIRVTTCFNNRKTKDHQMAFKTIPILMYHNIKLIEKSEVMKSLHVAPNAFKRQMLILKKLGFRAAQ